VERHEILQEVASKIQPEINIAMCGFCTRWQPLLKQSNDFAYDVVLPVVSDAGYDLG
jgi:hypothetical protein